MEKATVDDPEGTLAEQAGIRDAVWGAEDIPSRIVINQVVVELARNAQEVQHVNGGEPREDLSQDIVREVEDRRHDLSKKEGFPICPRTARHHKNRLL